MFAAPHILVVDDHRDIRELIGRYLVQNGLQTTLVQDAAAARQTLKVKAIDLVVLDIMMPGEDGLSLCRDLCGGGGDTPVILLTAMAEDTDRVVGLEMGADDYVTKPFNPRELLARIRAVLRRAAALPPQRDAVKTRRLRFSGRTLEVDRRELIGADGVTVPLSTAEFQLLVAFLKRPRMVLSREQLLDLTSGRAPQLFDRSIDNQVSRLRRKLEADPKAPSLIKTIWGGGYMLASDVEELA